MGAYGGLRVGCQGDDVDHFSAYDGRMMEGEDVINLNKAITTIEALLECGRDPELTYAALECRLALERICYDRLQVAHDYISHAEIRRWQPKHVMNILIEDVNPNAANQLTLCISRDSLKPEKLATLAEESDNLTWIPVGTQSAFDPSHVAKLWNALSHAALHARLPKKKGDEIAMYGQRDIIHKHVLATLEVLRTVAQGNMVGNGFGDAIAFECLCKTKNKRRADILADKTIVSCINPDCMESYVYESAASVFARRVLTEHCESCNEKIYLPLRYMDDLGTRAILRVNCGACKNVLRFRWVPMKERGGK